MSYSDLKLFALSSNKELAEKVAKTVEKTRKRVVLEPMSAYERKIIHS